MNWLSLSYFETAARTGSLGRCAALLNTDEDDVLKKLGEIDEEVGVSLLSRTGDSFSLTRYGRVLHSAMAFAGNEIEKAIGIIEDDSRLKKDVVSFSSIFSMGADFIPKLIKSFHEENPQIRLIYYQKSTRDILNDLNDEKIDFGFCGEFLRVSPFLEIDSKVVSIEEICLAVPEGHPLSGNSHVCFSDIVHETFIGYTDNTGITFSVENCLKESGYSLSDLNVLYRVAEDNTIIGMVRSGLGVAFVADTPSLYKEGVSLLHISYPEISRKLYMAWKKNGFLGHAAKTFKIHVLSSLKG